jgi:hypothetical protein
LKFEKPEEIVGGFKMFLTNGRLTRVGMLKLQAIAPDFVLRTFFG